MKEQLKNRTKELKKLHKEANELVSIVVASIKTTKNRNS